MCLDIYTSVFAIRFHSLTHTLFNLDSRSFSDDDNSNVTVTVTENKCDILFAYERSFSSVNIVCVCVHAMFG